MDNKYVTQAMLQLSIAKSRIMKMYEEGKSKKFIFETLKREGAFDGCCTTFMERLGDVIPELKVKKRTKKRGR